MTCAHCGEPIMGRAPNAVFCSTCRCERDKAAANDHQARRWARLLADPRRHSARNERKAQRDTDRRIDDDREYIKRVRHRTARWHREYRRREAARRRCYSCGWPVRPPLVNGRLSSTRLCAKCRAERWHTYGEFGFGTQM
jgi:hypothetical protein